MIIEREEFRVNLNTNELKLLSADELVNDMYKEYCKYSKLLELAKKDRIEVIKDTVRYMYYSEKLLISAQKWIHMREDKSLDKRKKYEEKEDFEYLQNILREEVFKIHPLKLHLLDSKDMKDIIAQLNLRLLNLILQNLKL